MGSTIQDRGGPAEAPLRELRGRRTHAGVGDPMARDNAASGKATATLALSHTSPAAPGPAPTGTREKRERVDQM